MIGFGDFSELSFSSKAAADPDANRSLLDSIAKGGADLVRLPADLMDETKRETASQLFRATERKQLFVDSFTAGPTANRFDAPAQFDLFNDRIRKETGVSIDNPLSTAWRDFIAQSTSGGLRDLSAMGDMMSPTTMAADYNAYLRNRVDDYFTRVRELKAQHAGKLDDLPDAPDRAGAAATARIADKNFKAEWSRADGNAIMDGVAMLAGGMWGSRQDPLFWLSFALPGGGVAKTAAGRVANAAIVQGAGNAAFSAAAQPLVQSWKAEAGLEHGWHEALKDVAFAGLIGGAAGGTLQGAGEAIKKLARGHGSVADLETVVKAQGRELDPETRAILPVAREADRADAGLLKALDGVPEPQARVIAADALVHVEEPTAPLPLGRRFFDLTIGDHAAKAAVKATRSADEAIDALRRDGAMLSALNSSDPALRDLGHVASLSSDAVRVQRAQSVPIDQAAIVHQMADTPATQARFMTMLAEQRATSVAEARSMITAQIAADNAQAAASARAWAPKPFPFKRDPSLLEYLAWKGGLQKAADLTYIVDKPQVMMPRIGTLFSKKGMSLDRAREAAVQAGYLHDAAQFADNVASTSTINDFLELVRREMAGEKIYPFGAKPEPKPLDQSFDAMGSWEHYTGQPTGWESLSLKQQERAAAIHMEAGVEPPAAVQILHLEGDVTRWAKTEGKKLGIPRDIEAEQLAARIMHENNHTDVELALEAAMIRLGEAQPRKGPVHEPDIPFDPAPVDAGAAPRQGEGIRAGGADGIRAADQGNARAPGGDPRGPGQGSSEAPVASRASDDALNLIPVETDGEVRFLPRDMADKAAPRAQHLADVVKACRA